MMILQDQQIDEIRNYLRGNGLDIPGVLDDLQDHFCCMMETRIQEGATFQIAFNEVRELIPPEDIRAIQADAIYYLTIKSKIMLVKGIFFTAFLSVFCYVASAIAFKLGMLGMFQGSAIIGWSQAFLPILSLVIFAFGFLPLLFRFGYKQFVAKLQA